MVRTNLSRCGRQMRSSLRSSGSSSCGTPRVPASPSRSSWPNCFDRSDVPGPPSLLDQPQRARDVDAPLPVVGVYTRIAEVVRRLQDPRADQRRVPMTQLCHEQRREPGDGWCREARTGGLRDGLTGAACWGTGGRSRRRRTDRPHSPELTDFACAARRGDANGGAAEGTVWSDCVHVYPRPVDAGRAGGPGGRDTHRVGGFTRHPYDVAVVIEVGGVVEGDADDERALPGVEGDFGTAERLVGRVRLLQVMCQLADAPAQVLLPRNEILRGARWGRDAASREQLQHLARPQPLARIERRSNVTTVALDQRELRVHVPLVGEERRAPLRQGERTAGTIDL